MEGLSRGVHFLRENARVIGIGLIAVVVVLAGLGLWKVASAGRAEKGERRAQRGPEWRVGGRRRARPGQGGAGGGRGTLRLDRRGFGGGRVPGDDRRPGGRLRGGAAALESFLERSSDHALAAGIERNLISLDRAEGNDEALAERLRAALATGSSALGRGLDPL